MPLPRKYKSKNSREKNNIASVLLSLKPGLGLADPRGHLMKVLALALREKSKAKTQATWLLYVYTLPTLMVSQQSAICLGMFHRPACELDVG